jgi:cytidine deaminase
MMSDRRKQFEACLKEFPQQVRDILQTIAIQAGRLSALQCSELTEKLGIDQQTLMLRLLPLAKTLAIAPLSRFQVGAVAMAGARNNPEQRDLYLGANIEFIHQDLNQAIHAEQSATMNAWHNGASAVHALAVSELPCGYCRQFLNEFDNNTEITVFIPSGKDLALRAASVPDLLPDAFGPSNLGHRTGLMSVRAANRRLKLKTDSYDQTVAGALSAAERSYAPYTQNFAGCAIETKTGKVYTGRNVENAAYNPGLTPLQSAILCMSTATIDKITAIHRVVLVEVPTAARQRKAVQLLLETWAPEIDLEYYEATP